jgi:hypothetical protein
MKWQPILAVAVALGAGLAGYAFNVGGSGAHLAGIAKALQPFQTHGSKEHLVVSQRHSAGTG